MFRQRRLRDTGDVSTRDTCSVLGLRSTAERPSVWCTEDYRSGDHQITEDTFTLDYIAKVIDFAPCQGCGSPTTKVRECSMVWYCQKCDICFGLDDTFSVLEASELVEMMSCALEHNTLRCEPCPDCSNNDPFKFVFFEDARKRLKLSCQQCGHTQDLNHGEVEDQVPVSQVVCDCGNREMSRFAIDKNEDGDLIRIKCRMCGKELELTPPHPRTFPPPTGRRRVSNLSMLTRGDHIALERRVGHDHHAIVLDVDLNESRITCIEYGSFRLSPKGIVKQVERRIECAKEDVCKYDYEECHSPEVVVERAKSKLGETEYNMVWNNCEHFALWCKTGISQSSQVDKMISHLKSVAMNSTLHFGKDEAVSAFMKSKIGRKAIGGSFGGCRKLISGFGVVIELSSMAKDLYDLHQQKTSGDMTQREFLKCTITRVGDTVVGKVAGPVLGQIVIPIPYAGGLIGHALGTLLVNWLTRMLGRTVVQLMDVK